MLNNLIPFPPLSHTHNLFQVWILTRFPKPWIRIPKALALSKIMSRKILSFTKVWLSTFKTISIFRKSPYLFMLRRWGNKSSIPKLFKVAKLTGCKLHFRNFWLHHSFRNFCLSPSSYHFIQWTMRGTASLALAT